MTTTALTPRAAPSLYSGMMLALLALALALQASFVAGLVRGSGSPARPPATPSIIAVSASSPAPCAIP